MVHPLNTADLLEFGRFTKFAKLTKGAEAPASEVNSPLRKSRRNSEFDPTCLDNEALELHLACLDLANLPALPGESLLRRAQLAQLDNRPEEAIQILRDYLAHHRLPFSEQHEIHHERLALLKRLRKISQKTLSAAVGLSSSRLCQIEGSRGRLDFVRLLVMSEILDVEPWHIVGERRLSLLERSEPLPAVSSVSSSKTA